VREWVQISIVDRTLSRGRPLQQTDRVGCKASLEQFLPGLLGIRHGVDDRDQLVSWIAQLDSSAEHSADWVCQFPWFGSVLSLIVLLRSPIVGPGIRHLLRGRSWAAADAERGGCECASER
jgi:hypothetical protein